MIYNIKNPAGEIIADSTFPICAKCVESTNKGCSSKIKCSRDGKFRRIGSAQISDGQVFLCSSLDDDLNSSRVFKARLDAYGTTVHYTQQVKDTLYQPFDKQLKRLTHNLTSLNAHCMQELFALVPQETLVQNIEQQLKFIKDVLKASPQEAAKAFLRIAKNNLAMKLEFVAIHYLNDKTQPPICKDHSIRKVVLNVLHTFFQDFSDHNVYVKVDDSDLRAFIDYDTFHVAVYDVIDNATKYIMPHSTLAVRFSTDGNFVKVTFEMLSIPIMPHEIVCIGNEGFSGSIAQKLSLAGSGMGMFRTRKLLNIIGGDISIEPNFAPLKRTNHNGIDYEYNRFSLIMKIPPEKKSKRYR